MEVKLRFLFQLLHILKCIKVSHLWYHEEGKIQAQIYEEKPDDRSTTIFRSQACVTEK